MRVGRAAGVEMYSQCGTLEGVGTQGLANGSAWLAQGKRAKKWVRGKLRGTGAPPPLHGVHSCQVRLRAPAAGHRARRGGDIRGAQGVTRRSRIRIARHPTTLRVAFGLHLANLKRHKAREDREADRGRAATDNGHLSGPPTPLLLAGAAAPQPRHDLRRLQQPPARDRVVQRCVGDLIHEHLRAAKSAPPSAPPPARPPA